MRRAFASAFAQMSTHALYQSEFLVARFVASLYFDAIFEGIVVARRQERNGCTQSSVCARQGATFRGFWRQPEDLSCYKRAWTHACDEESVPHMIGRHVKRARTHAKNTRSCACTARNICNIVVALERRRDSHLCIHSRLHGAVRRLACSIVSHSRY
jgi:hypothetical protein